MQPMSQAHAEAIWPENLTIGENEDSRRLTVIWGWLDIMSSPPVEHKDSLRVIDQIESIRLDIVLALAARDDIHFVVRRHRMSCSGGLEGEIKV